MKIMKKQYIIPQTEIVNIESPAILAGSDPGFGGPGSGNADSRELEDLFLLDE